MELNTFFETIAKGFLILLTLNFLYFLCFKLIKWKSRLISIVLGRARVFVYILINMLSIWWFINYFSATKYTPYILKGFEIVFCFLISILLIEVFSTSLFDYFIPKFNKEETLGIYRQLIKAIIYIVTFFFLIGLVLKINITHLLTTSAIISVVIGLALQDTLGNLFSGLALNLSKPYQIGDWVKIGNYEGRIHAINWRSTSIETMDNNIAVFPHSFLSKMEVLNYSNPTKAHVKVLPINIHYMHSPNKVKNSLMEVLLSTDGILKDPYPRIRLKDYGDFAIRYLMVFWIEDFPGSGQILTNVMEKIWYKFKRDEITVPYPIRDIYTHESLKSITRDEKVNLLKNVDFLNELGDEELSKLADRLKIHTYCDKEEICSQNEKGDSFYIIHKGSVLVKAVDDNSNIYLEKEMHEGNFFGEISLLTGDLRSATVTANADVELLAMGKEDLRFILKTNPKVEEIISSAIARRQQASIAQRAKSECTDGEVNDCVQDEIKSIADDFLKKIRYFFSY